MEDTLQLVAEVVRVLTTEATLRASKQAHVEDMTEVQVSHVEKILPQLVSVLSSALSNASAYVTLQFHFIPSLISVITYVQISPLHISVSLNLIQKLLLLK
jgi:hypothetical protein